MRYFPIRTVLLSLFFLILFSCAPSDRKIIVVDYFYASHCNDCEEAGERLKALKTDFSFQERKIRLEVNLRNVLTDSGWEALTAVLAETDVPLSAQNLPLLFIGDRWFYGEEDISSAVSLLESRRLPIGEAASGF